jgi:hypothetical protein
VTVVTITAISAAAWGNVRLRIREPSRSVSDDLAAVLAYRFTARSDRAGIGQ